MQRSKSKSTAKTGLNIFQHEKINFVSFVSPSDNVIFFLIYRMFTIHDDVCDYFPKLSDHIPKIFQNWSKGQTNVSEHFRAIYEDFRKMTEEDQRCFDHTPVNLKIISFQN